MGRRVKPTQRPPGRYGTLYVTTVSITRQQQNWTYEVATKYNLSRSHIVRRALEVLKQHLDEGGSYFDEDAK